jgi:hypothetical protein
VFHTDIEILSKTVSDISNTLSMYICNLSINKSMLLKENSPTSITGQRCYAAYGKSGINVLIILYLRGK